MVKKENKWEDFLYEQIKSNTSYPVEREFRFHDKRRWRFDVAVPSQKLAFELEGGVWTGGRHIHPVGFEKDLEKYNTATMMGWSVYRFVPRMLNQDWIEQIFQERE